MDDRWIAINLVAGCYHGAGIQHDHLLLVPADLKTDISEQFEFDFRSLT
jgi:hypothetical protein